MSSGTSGPLLREGELLHGASSVYSIQELIGEGSFGKVLRCRDTQNLDTVAVKVLKENQGAERELSILKALGTLDPDLNNLVRFLEHFDHLGHTCLAFEMLDINLYDLVELEGFEPIFPSEIRPIAQQLLVALEALRGLRILHGDIKPDNVMLSGAVKRPLRVKLIDFGEAVAASEVGLGMVLQPIGYRAPEVCLGLPFSEAIDVWGVGCVLAFLYLADNLFPVDCEYQMMKSMVDLLGQPPDRLLWRGGYTKYFFTEEEEANASSVFRLMTPEEYTAINKTPAQERHSSFQQPSSLDQLVYMYPLLDASELQEREAFLDLLKGLLHLDGEMRLTPSQALKHPFFTGSCMNQDPEERDGGSDSPQDLLESPETGSDSPQDPQELAEPGSDSTENIQESLELGSDSTEDIQESLELGSDSTEDIQESPPTDSPDSLQDQGSGLSELPGTCSDSGPSCSLTGLDVSVLHEESDFRCSDESGAEDVCLQSSTSSGPFRRVRERIRKLFRRIQSTFCSCFKPQTAEQ